MLAEGVMVPGPTHRDRLVPHAVRSWALADQPVPRRGERKQQAFDELRALPAVHEPGRAVGDRLPAWVLCLAPLDVVVIADRPPTDGAGWATGEIVRCLDSRIQDSQIRVQQISTATSPPSTDHIRPKRPLSCTNDQH
jgi:hypothetical protein